MKNLEKMNIKYIPFIIILCLAMLMLTACGSKTKKDGFTAYSEVYESLNQVNVFTHCNISIEVGEMLFECELVTSETEIKGDNKLYLLVNEFGIRFLEGYEYEIEILDDSGVAIYIDNINFITEDEKSFSDTVREADFMVIIAIAFIIQAVVFGGAYILRKAIRNLREKKKKEKRKT